MNKIFSTLKKILLSAVVIVAFSIYAIRQYILGTDQPSISANTIPISSSLPTETPYEISTPLPLTGVPSPTSTFVPTPTSIPTPRTGKYRDGQYTGLTADAYYGPLQVKVIIQGGKLVDVQFLQYPNDRRTSITINSQALPLLKMEAISAQNAQVDGITGASASSPAFIQSLASALEQAQRLQ